MLFKRPGLYSPASIPPPSKADLTDRLDTIFSSFINAVQQSHLSVPVALLGENCLLLEMLTVLLHNLPVCSCKSLTFCHCTCSAQTRRAFSSTPNLYASELRISRPYLFTMIQLIESYVIIAWRLTACFHLQHHPNRKRITHITGHGPSEFKQYMAADYEQVQQKLKRAHSAPQPEQWHAVRTVSNTGTIIQSGKHHHLPRLPQLPHVLLAITQLITGSLQTKHCSLTLLVEEVWLAGFLL